MSYYELLGISPNASLAQIRVAYHSLAKQYHPDRFHRLGESARKYVQEKMLLLNEAYRVLSDPHERQKYDQEIQRKSVSSQTYARFVELDWKINKLLHEDKTRKLPLRQILAKRNSQIIPLSWLRGIGLFFLLLAGTSSRLIFWDLCMVVFFLISALSAKRQTWLSRSGFVFFITWWCLWGWIIIVFPSIRFPFNSDPRYGFMIIIPLLLFFVNQYLFARLLKQFAWDRNADWEREFSERQHELNQLFEELRKLDYEIFGSENSFQSQTR